MSLINNAKWVSFSQFGRIIIQLLSLTVLTRIIPPSDYGLMAMGTVVVNLVLIFRDLGTAAAIIQRKKIDELTINSVFWLNVFMGIGLFVLISLFSPFISLFFSNQQLTPLLILLAISFPFASFGAVHQALLERDSKFKKITLIELISALAGFVIAIVVAINGGGVYGLASQLLANSFIASFCYYITSNWRPKFSFSFSNIKDILGFSGNLTAFNLINFLSRNLDSVIVGHRFDTVILGSYSLAYRIMLFPLQSLTFVASRSLYPILSRKQDDLSEVGQIYNKTIFVIASLTAPMMLGLAILREPFVKIAFGENWLIVPSLLLWLAPTGFIQSILSCSGSLFMAANKTNVLFRLGVFGAVFQIFAFIAGSFYDIEVFVKLYLIANIINAFPVIYYTGKLVRTSFLSFFKAFLAPLVACIGMFIVLRLEINFSSNLVVSFICQVILGTMIYSLCYLICIYAMLKLRIESKKNIPDFYLKMFKLS